MFADFCGNRAVGEALEQVIASGRIPQTLLFAGPEGVGKATLARRFGARLLGGAEKIERDDLSLPHNAEYLAEREKWPAQRRVEDPLLFATQPDFVTFPPDGPLRQILISQMRLLKEQARLRPLRGERRVFLIDQIDRAGEQAANSLLKTLEEPPEHLILILTAANPYDLLPTIRSRAVWFHFPPLSDEEMQQFISARKLDQVERRIALARGSPGVAVSLDLEAYDRGCAGMMALLKVSAGEAPFETWLKYAESAAARQDRLEDLLRILYLLLQDVLYLQRGRDGIRNQDLRGELEPLARRVSFAWMRRAVRKVDELAGLVRRNIQKSIALDAMVVELRGAG